MTDEQDGTFSGWASPQQTEGFIARENAKEKERKKGVPQRRSAFKNRNRETKHRKYTPRHLHNIEIDKELTMNRNRKLDTSAKEASNINRESCQKQKYDSTDLLSFSWKNNYPVIAAESENALLPILLPLGKSERGMIKNQPRFRVQKIIKSCQLHGMHLEQALSLRRTYMKLLNPKVKSMTQLGLGNIDDIHGAANLFESAALKYLKECGIPFLTEKDQKRRFLEKSKPGENMPPTPDFMLTSPMDLITLQPTNGDSANPERGQINWIEAKMFYGASTIPDGTSNAVGNILPTAKKYIKNYGPGAFIFAFGCGSELRAHLRDLGISVLDSHPLNLNEMQQHQKRWCADKNGVILP